MTTVRDLIASSLRLITVLGEGETITASMAVDGLSALNQMVSAWSADGAILYSNSTDQLVLTSNVNTYTIGPAGSINTVRPVQITAATITQGQTVTPVNVWRKDVYAGVTFQDVQSVPTSMYVNNDVPLLSFVLDPKPVGGLTLTLYSLKPLSDFTLDDVLTLPPGYERALRFNLAVELAPEYEREASRTVQEKAASGLATITTNAQEYSRMPISVDPALQQQYMGNFGYDIYRGY